ncbi:MAG: hypothetical protein KAT15_29175, partial [Bacteroidales bacterium]|nr:hypothetical protein [Bacteroidales bacterium]
MKIEVINATGSTVDESLDNSNYLVFSTDEYDKAFFSESSWKEVVGRDVIVPVINSGNPLMNEILRQGISPEELAQIINNPGMTSWGTLLQTGQNVPANLFVIDDASIHAGIAKLLNVDQIRIDGNKVEDGNDLISAVQNDLYSIGICKITDVIDPDHQSLFEQVKLLPIDKDGNGKIEYKENIYDDLNAFSRGVWIGKYPDALFSNIYSFSASQPTNESEVAFLKWIFTDGQRLLDNYGYSDLIPNERLAKVRLIDNYDINRPAVIDYAIPKESLFSRIYFLAILMFITILLIMTILGFVYRENSNTGILEKIPVPRLVFNEDVVESPPGLYYDKTHTWAFMEKDGLVKIGIDDFLQHITGPLTRIKMKHPGERVRKGKHVFSIIQDGKQLDIRAPVTGTIKEQNKVLATDTSIINSSPYSEGWIYKIEPTNWQNEIQILSP